MAGNGRKVGNLVKIHVKVVGLENARAVGRRYEHLVVACKVINELFVEVQMVPPLAGVQAHYSRTCCSISPSHCSQSGAMKVIRTPTQ